MAANHMDGQDVQDGAVLDGSVMHSDKMFLCMSLRAVRMRCERAVFAL